MNRQAHEISVPNHTHNYGHAVTCDNRTRPFAEDDFDNRYVLFYKIPGFGEKDLQVTEDWNNREKRMMLKIEGRRYFARDTELKVDIEFIVDTDMYNGYKLVFMDGVLAVELHEIINERPEFERKVD